MSSLSAYSDHAFVAEGVNTSWSNLYTFVPDGSRVLDFGCSTGNFGAALKNLKNCEVVGVDINESDVAIAKTQLDAAFVLDITMPEAAQVLGTFDIVVFADVLEHLADPRAVLASVHRLLRAGGRVIYSIPNMAHVSVRLDLLAGKFPYSEIGLLDATHLHFYERFEVNAIFADAGFGIVEELPTVSKYPDAWVRDRVLALGLTPSSSFFAMLETTDAAVFQYVGVAAPTALRGANPAPSRSVVLPPDLLGTRVSELTVENERLTAELIGLHARFARFRRNPVAGAIAELRRYASRRKS